MKRATALSPLCVLTLIVLPAYGGEKKLLRNQLPVKVLATADREMAGATIKGYATETEHGKKVYEVESVVNGHTRDLQIASDGTLNEIEEEVAMKELAVPVSSAILSRAKGATVIKVESLTKSGKLVAYEASTEKSGRKGEIQVGPDGGILAHEE